MTKIPQQAKRVFKGVIFEVYQWEQEMFDGSKEIFEMIHRPATIQIIPTVGDKILLSFEEQPTKPRTFTFLGGRQEEGEDPLVCAKRELLEEAGLESQDWELIKTYGEDNLSKIDWVTYLFAARNCLRVAEPDLDPGEKIDVKELFWEEFLEKVSSEDFWGDTISNDFFRAMQEPEKLEAFKSKIFPED